MQSAQLGWAALGTLLFLASCSDSATNTQRSLDTFAGGETSEFSGGSTPSGYCPVEVSRTSFDLTHPDVADWVALASGQREVPLRWRREVPSEGVRGFEADTTLAIDVTPVAALSVVCSNGGSDAMSDPGPIGELDPEQSARWRAGRIQLDVAMSTADGALQASFQSTFHTVPLERLLVGEGILPLSDNAGRLELGFDGVPVDARQLYVSMLFGERTVTGTVTALLALPPADGAQRPPSFAPIAGRFPGPDPGCELGRVVSLDAHRASLGATARAAYDAAITLVTARSLRAAWIDPRVPTSALSWTDVSVVPSAPQRACSDGSNVEVYSSLQIASGDGAALAEPAVVGRLFRIRPEDGAGVAFGIDWRAPEEGWAASAEFVASAGIQGLDLSGAEYAAHDVFLSADVDRGREKIRGGLGVSTWRDFVTDSSASPALRWCAGLSCEQNWCFGTAPGNGTPCPVPDGG